VCFLLDQYNTADQIFDMYQFNTCSCGITHHRVSMPPEKSWIFLLKLQHLESPGKSLWSWKVLEKLFQYNTADRIIDIYQFNTCSCGITHHRVPMPPEKSWIFPLKLQHLESPGKSLWSWKVLEKLLPPDVIFYG